MMNARSSSQQQQQQQQQQQLQPMPAASHDGVDITASSTSDETKRRRYRQQPRDATIIAPLVVGYGHSMGLTVEGNPLSINSLSERGHFSDGVTTVRRTTRKLSPDFAKDQDRNAADRRSKVAMTTKNKPVSTFDERPQSVQRRQMMMHSLSKLTCLGLTYKHLLIMNKDKKLQADTGEDEDSERTASNFTTRASKPGLATNPFAAAAAAAAMMTTTMSSSRPASSLRLEPVTLSYRRHPEMQADIASSERTTNYDSSSTHLNIQRRRRPRQYRAEKPSAETSVSVDRIVNQLLMQLQRQTDDSDDDLQSRKTARRRRQWDDSGVGEREIETRTVDGGDQIGSSRTSADAEAAGSGGRLLLNDHDPESKRRSGLILVSTDHPAESMVGVSLMADRRGVADGTELLSPFVRQVAFKPAAVTCTDDYSDPSSGASPAFQRRINEMALLENRTKIWERRLAKGAAVNSLPPMMSSSGLHAACVCKAISSTAAMST